MKKLFIITTLLLIGQIQAQVTFKPGIKVGANISKLTNFEATSKTNFYVGGLLAIKLTKIYTLQPELIYSRQGAISNFNYDKISIFNDPAFRTNSKVKYSLDYLSLGVINKFTFGKGFNVVIGPSIDFKVSDNFKMNNTDNPVGVDFALIGGLGYSFSNGLSIDARVKQGMVDVFGDNYNKTVDNNNNGNYDEVKLNQLFQLGVSYTFDIK